jgi:hypothetical protein
MVATTTEVSVATAAVSDGGKVSEGEKVGLVKGKNGARRLVQLNPVHPCVAFFYERAWFQPLNVVM